MNTDTLRQIAQFSIRARKLVGSIDLKQFTENETYRDEILRQVDGQADEELLLMSLSIREALTKPEEVKPVVADLKVEPTKYMFGARG